MASLVSFPCLPLHILGVRVENGGRKRGRKDREQGRAVNDSSFIWRLLHCIFFLCVDQPMDGQLSMTMCCMGATTCGVCDGGDEGPGQNGGKKGDSL